MRFIVHRWARQALRLLIDLIITGGSAGGFRNPNVTSFADLDPPFLDDLMREGLGEDDDMPEAGECRARLALGKGYGLLLSSSIQ